MSGVSNWSGYLLMATKTSKKFPPHLIEAGTWKMSKAIEDIKAYRDENTRNLTRVVAKGHKASFEFSTVDNLSLADVDKIMDFFDNNESNTDEQKISLKYWDSKNRVYKTGNFYRPATEFPIKQYTDTDITHGKLTLKFVEY